MAELSAAAHNAPGPGNTGPDPLSLPPIPATTQIAAVAWLRWRIFVNGFARRRSSTARQAVNIVFTVLLRLLVWPFLALMVIGPVAGSGFLAWTAIARHHPQRLQTLLAGIALLWQFVSINGLSIAATVSSFDPSSLIRYPLRFGRYFFLRSLIGFLAPSTIVGCLAALAAAIGVGIARPAFALPALVVLAVYALMNVFLTRMIGAWMERWLANRRFREIFSVLMALSAVSVQLLNFQRYPQHHHATGGWLIAFLQSSGSYLHWLPPGFAANAILRSSHFFAALAQFILLLASTALFAAVFAIRLRKQFLGEYLGEGTARQAHVSRLKHVLQKPAASATPAALAGGNAFPPIIAACLRKEWITFRGNSAQFIGLITPLVFIVILNRGIFALHPTLFLPGAIAYVLIGVLANLYNVFGADGLGVQIYLLAPIRMRDVILAKNIAGLILITAEVGLAWTLVSLLKRIPIQPSTQVSTLLWLVFVVAGNLALGTFRSIQAPRKFTPGYGRQRRGIPTNRTSGLLILVMLFGSLLLQIPVQLLCKHFQQPWIAAWVFAPLAAIAVGAYWLLLVNAERLVMAHRDVFAEALCKT